MTTQNTKSQDHCTHCGVHRSKAKALVQLSSGALLCDGCAVDIHAFLTEAAAPAAARPEGRMTPRAIINFLDDYVIGQEDAKRALAIAVYNHYKRLDVKCDVELTKSNVLMIGPTGTGKTLLAQSIARLLDVPLAIADATSLTQAGYVGDDVESILQLLIQAAGGDIAKAERGIIFIDEIDKLAKLDAGPSVSKDVNGEGVQQALLKLIEGTRVAVPAAGGRKMSGANTSYIDTSNILFICAGAFSTLMDAIHAPEQQKTLGFTAKVEEAKPDAKEVTPEKLFKFGMIPEFIGRLPVITTLNPLKAEDIERILVTPKNAVVKQMAALLKMDEAELVLADGATRAVAEKALKLKTGARGARGVLEKLLEPAMLDVPEKPGAVVTIGADLAVDVSYPAKGANDSIVKLVA